MKLKLPQFDIYRVVIVCFPLATVGRIHPYLLSLADFHHSTLLHSFID